MSDPVTEVPIVEEGPAETTSQPLSKKAQKKLAKAASLAEKKKERRANEKEKRKEKKRKSKKKKVLPLSPTNPNLQGGAIFWSPSLKARAD